MIDLETLLRFGLALALVLALIAGLAWLAKRGMFGALPITGGPRRRRLTVIETAALDGRTRAVLLRRDATEHLVVVGPHGVAVVERGLGPATPHPAAP